MLYLYAVEIFISEPKQFVPGMTFIAFLPKFPSHLLAVIYHILLIAEAYLFGLAFHGFLELPECLYIGLPRGPAKLSGFLITDTLRLPRVPLPYLHPADLPADGLGQLVHELDDAGIFIGRGHILDVVLQLLLERL